MSPEFQEVFNLNKGFHSGTSGVNKAKVRRLRDQSMTDFDATAKSGGLEPSFAHGCAVSHAEAPCRRDRRSS